MMQNKRASSFCRSTNWLRLVKRIHNSFCEIIFCSKFSESTFFDVENLLCGESRLWKSLKQSGLDEKLQNKGKRNISPAL